jgi:peroxin-5
MSSQRDELDHDYGGLMQQAWENGIGDFQENSLGAQPVRFDNEGLPILGEYVFGMSSVLCHGTGLNGLSNPRAK